MLDLQVRIGFTAQPIPVGATGAADNQRPQLSLCPPVQLVNFKLDKLPFARSGIAGSGGLPICDVEENVLAVVLGLDKAELAAFVHVADASQPPARDDKRLLNFGHNQLSVGSRWVSSMPTQEASVWPMPVRTKWGHIESSASKTRSAVAGNRYHAPAAISLSS